MSSEILCPMYLIGFHQLCQLQRRCPHAAGTKQSNLHPHLKPISHYGPVARGPWAECQVVGAESLRWPSATSVLIRFNRDSPPLPHTDDDSVGQVAEPDRMSIPGREQTTSTSLQQPSYVDSLTLKALSEVPSPRAPLHVVGCCGLCF